ncbi:uncharacterized protein LOC117817673 isoform X2 [Notolabrus celidotus]|uniref:uncharacterized protein LOC117817673 isoform X2 n=1 Tax=Notolabrus celidotus TaxID=1203425 RepID=UPI00148F5B1A|nr:uncharacterized protein LOC117817673 isoform X2 [Notolabrus celidotus]
MSDMPNVSSGESDELESIDAILTDLHNTEKEEGEQGKKAKEKVKHTEKPVRWRKRDMYGRLLADMRPSAGGSRSSHTLKSKDDHQGDATTSSEATLIHVQEAQETFDVQLQMLKDSLMEDPLECSEATATVFRTWETRQTLSDEKWEHARPQLLELMLSAEKTPLEPCDHCNSEQAVIRCRDCLPKELFCSKCDVSIHQHGVLHNRDSLVKGFYEAIPPTCFVSVNENGAHTFSEQACLLPIAWPSSICSCDAVDITVTVGRAIILVTINGRYDLSLPVLTCKSCLKSWTPVLKDLQTSGYWPGNVEFYTIYTVDVFHTFEELKVTAPACTQDIAAISVDGNRKMYRFSRTKGMGEKAYFDGAFFAKDKEVADFVEIVRNQVQPVHGKGVCGKSQWTAAKETAKKSGSKVDEEGVEVAVCRHGVLFKALNMFRGEIFAYPLFLQKELAMAHNIEFICTDIMCKYYPYLQRVCESFPDLHPLLRNKPFLSVMHAKGHSGKCEVQWGGRNQEGAGMTVGEEVEQVNSFLSRVALTTKYMTKSARTDMITTQARGWNVRKKKTLHKYLSQRYVKILERTIVEENNLYTLKRDLEITDVDSCSGLKMLRHGLQQLQLTSVQKMLLGFSMSWKTWH